MKQCFSLNTHHNREVKAMTFRQAMLFIVLSFAVAQAWDNLPGDRSQPKCDANKVSWAEEYAAVSEDGFRTTPYSELDQAGRIRLHKALVELSLAASNEPAQCGDK